MPPPKPDDPNCQPGADDLLYSTQSAARTNANNGFVQASGEDMKLLIALVQASGEDMIMSAIQLLRVALVTRLLLLLIALMIIATLVTLITLLCPP